MIVVQGKGGQDPQPQKPLAERVRDSYAEPQEPAASLAARVRDSYAQEDQEAQQGALKAFEIAARTNPDIRAEAQQIAGQLGLPIDTAERNIDVLREKARRERDKARALEGMPEWKSPLWDRIEFARIADDQRQRLGEAAVIAQNWEAGGWEAELGPLYNKLRTRTATKEDEDRIVSIEQHLQTLARPDGFVSGSARVLGQMKSQVGRAVVAGTATGLAAAAPVALASPATSPITATGAFLVGGGVGFAGSMARQTAESEAGFAFREMTDPSRPGGPIDFDRAYWISGGVGAMNAVVEMGGLAAVSRPFLRVAREQIAEMAGKAIIERTMSQAAIRAASAYATGVAANVGEEIVQEATTAIGVEFAEKGLGMLRDSDGGAMVSRIAQVGADAAQAMALLGLPGPVLGLAHDARRVKSAEKTKELVVGLQQNVGTLAERSPDAAKAVVEDMLPGQQVYIDAKTVRDILLQRDGDGETEAKPAKPVEKDPAELVEAKLPGFLADVQAAAERGDDVAMPLSDYVAKVQPHLGDKLNDFVRMKQDDATPAEAAKVDIPAMAKDAEKDALAAAEEAKQWTAEAKAIEDDIATQLDAARPGKKLEARETARGWRAVVETITDRIGETPKWFAEQWKVKIQQGEVAADALAQGETKTDSPEFKAWFGESKVVDKEGKPLVVYHGTKAGTAFDEFDIERSGRTDEGWLGRGLYFTTNKYTANAYGDVSAREPLSEEGAWNVTKDRRGRVGAFYLAMRNPLVLKPEGQGWIKQAVIRKALGLPRSANPAEVSAALQAAGHDGVVLDYSATGGLGDERELMALRPQQIKSVNNRGTFDTNDPNILRQDGDVTRGGFQRIANELRITLTPDANFSTPIHEMLGHALLEVYGDLALQKAHPTIVDDFQTLLDWGGIKDAAEWKALPMEKRKGLHEKFAREWEAFVWEGKEPSSGLKRLFAVLSRLIRRVYETILSIPGREAAVPPEVREVMRRMVASERDVEVAKQVRGAVDLFADAKTAGMDEAAWQKHLDMRAEAAEQAVNEVQRRSLRDMHWLLGKVSGMDRELRAQAERVRKAERPKVAAEVESRPVYRALRWLKTGEFVNPDGTKTSDPAKPKLDREVVRQLLGLAELDEKAIEQAVAAAPKVRRGPSMLTRIKQLGGISTESWNKSWPGEKRGEFRLPFVVRPKGMKWEAMASQLRSEGYAPQVNDEAGVGSGDSMWLVDALSDAASGVATYSQNDEVAAIDTRNPAPETAEERADRMEAERMDREEEMARRATIQTARPEKDLAKLRGILRNDGVHPDDAAKLFEFPSGGELLRAILEADPIEVEIERQTDAVMLEKHAEVADPKKRRAAIERALHNKVRQRVLASEIGALLKGQRPTRVILAAANRAARATLEAKRVRDLNAGALSVLAKRSSQEALQLLKKGDTAGAVSAKLNELKYSAMAHESAEIEVEIERARKTFRNLDRADSDVAKSRDIDLVNAARMIGERFGLSAAAETSQQRMQRAEGVERLREVNPDIGRRFDALMDEFPGGFDYRDMSLGRFREMADLALQLWERAKAERELGREGKKIEARLAVDEIGNRLAKLPPSGPQPPAGRSASWGNEKVQDGYSWLTSHKIAEIVAYGIDGGDGGPVMRHLILPIMRTATGYREALADRQHRLLAIFNKAKEAAGENWTADVHLPTVNYTFKGKHELLHALAHSGSTSGFRKWILGKKGADGKPFGSLVKVGDEDVLDSSRWDQDIAALWGSGYLTAADVEALNATWDLFADTFKEVQRTMKAEEGYEAVALEMRPQQTPHGELRGGYVPARTDRFLADKKSVQTLDEAQAMADAVRYSVRPHDGMTKERNPNYNQPLITRLSTLMGALDEELRYIHFTGPANDVMRALRTKGTDGVTLSEKLAAYDRSFEDGVLIPFVQNSSLQRSGARGSNPMADAVANFLRSTASLTMLGLNLPNALLQLTGFSTAASDLGRYMADGAGVLARDPAKAYDDARTKSAYMAQRFDQNLREGLRQVAKIGDPPVTEAAKDWAAFWGRAAFLPQRAAQGVVDVATWHAGYARAKANGMAEVDAIEAADSAVRRLQGSNNPESQSKAFNESTPAGKLWLQFTNYQNLILGNLLAARSMPKSLLFNILLPSMLEAGLRMLVKPDNDEPWDEELAENIGSSVLRNTVGLVPIAGPAFTALVQSEGQRVMSAAGPETLTALWKGGRDFYKAMTDGVDKDSRANNIAALLTLLLRMPVAAPTRLAQSVDGESR